MLSVEYLEDQTYCLRYSSRIHLIRYSKVDHSNLDQYFLVGSELTDLILNFKPSSNGISSSTSSFSSKSASSASINDLKGCLTNAGLASAGLPTLRFEPIFIFFA